MSVRIALLLTWLVMASHADASALQDYFLKNISRSSSRIRLVDEYKHGFVLKNFPDGAEPFNATLKLWPGENDGVVFVYHFFKPDSCRSNEDTLELLSWCSLNPAFILRKISKNCSRYIMETEDAKGCRNDRAKIEYVRQNNSNSRFELTLTGYTNPPCGEKFECENKICVWAKLRCDGRDNCGDGSDERGCRAADGREITWTDYCEDEFEEMKCGFLCIALGLLWLGVIACGVLLIFVLVLVLFCLGLKMIFEESYKCYRRRCVNPANIA